MNDIHLSVLTFGILVYSPYAATAIAPNSNFLDEKFARPDQVLPFVYEGSLVAFQTGDGFYHLKFHEGYPDHDLEYMMRLGVLVRDRTLCFRDLYDLYDWNPVCPSCQELKVNDGYYHLTISSDRRYFPQNEIEISIYLNPLAEMPKLDYRGNLPVLFD